MDLREHRVRRVMSGEQKRAGGMDKEGKIARSDGRDKCGESK